MRPLLRPHPVLRTARTAPAAAGRAGLLAGPTSFATRALHRPGSGGSGTRGLHPRTTTNTELHRMLSLQLQTRAFHPSPRRQDVFFVAVPAIKSTLLGITRISLLFLPFVFRYK